MVGGIEFSAKTLLRFGVGRPGLRLSVGDVENVGLGPVAAVIGFVLATPERCLCNHKLGFLNSFSHTAPYLPNHTKIEPIKPTI